MQDRYSFDHTGGRFLSSREAHPLVNQLNKFLYSPVYMVLVAGLTLLSNVFACEIIAYPLIIAIGIYTILFCRDMLPTMPLFACGYITPSVANNPGRNSGSIFYPANGGWLIIGLLLLVCVALIVRFSLDKSLRTKLFKDKRTLWPGFALLGISFFLSGIGSQHYTEVFSRNLAFALLQIISMSALYWFFSGAVYWEKAPKNYFSWIGLMLGVVITCELANIYLTGNVIQDGMIRREAIFTGWGTYNNIGGLLVTFLPFPYYFASQSKKHAWMHHLLGLLMLTGIIFSNSRGAILCAMVIYAVCTVLTLWKGNKRIQNLAAYVVSFALVVAVCYCYQEEIGQVFLALINKKLESSGRDQIYLAGLQQFLRNPLFGGSFFPETELPTWAINQGFVAFFPPRWHNTLVQMTASCGSLGLLAYGWHRVQTTCLFLKTNNRTVEKAFLALSILALLGTSLLDCHLFNVGPAMYYSLALAYGEHSAQKEL